MPNQDQTDMRELLRQQTALARFGELALRSDNLNEILQEACRHVSDALGTHLGKVMELQEDGTLFVRAGIGWQPGIVGQKTVTREDDNATAFALNSGEPVIITDLAKDDRFEIAEFVKEHGVRALVNVNILGKPGGCPYGILEVDSRTPRKFTENDIDFLRTYANLIAAIVERLRVVAELRQRADEKEQLLQELQHRTKNNLQVISSLIRLQSQRAEHPDVRSELQKITSRLESLRILHDKLYSTGEVNRVDLGGYLVDFAGAVLRFHGELSAKIRLVTEVERIMVPAQTAVPLGLITNEFITNSLKYAFHQKGGRIGLQAENGSDEGPVVRLWDDGSGLPRDRRNGTGMYLIENLARQIASEVTWSSEGGTSLRLKLRPTTESHARVK